MQGPEQTLFASCPRNVAPLLAEELTMIGATGLREHPAGVSFNGPVSLGYLACLHSRTASRVMLQVSEAAAGGADEFYASIKGVPWENHLAADGTLAVDVVGESPKWLRDKRYAARRAKDAIADRFRDRTGQRPSVDFGDPDLRINLRLGRGRVTVSVDLSGEPLHRRGYRRSGVEAPLKENLAAALLLRCGWSNLMRRGAALVDPMCGSGTLVIESALMAAHIAPGLLRRHFGFERWLQHDAAAWQQMRAEAAESGDPGVLGVGRFRGFDTDQTAVRAAIANANRAGLGDHLTFERRELTGLRRSEFAEGLAIVNPPYGARLGETSALRKLYAELGAGLLKCFPGWEAGVFTGNPSLGRALGLRAYRSHVFFNGSIECRLLRFKLDESSLEPDREQLRHERRITARARPGAEMFANRLRKNLTRVSAWARRQNVSCFRVYDADMPEYAFAIDLYGNATQHACVQEYTAPSSVDPVAARARRDEALSVLPEVLGVDEQRIHFKQRKRQRAGAQYEKADETGDFLEVHEGGYRFLVNFTDYLDTGLFLDHRLTRQRVAQLATGRRFLNLFAYTGTATVYAVGSGATASTTVDLSRTYLDWAKRNLEINGLAGSQHDFVQADCLEWLQREAALADSKYGVIFVDPPTVSRSRRMQRSFDVQRDHVWLIQQAGRLLEPDGTILFSNNFRRFRLDADALESFAIEDITRSTIPEDFRRNQKIHHCFLLRK